MNISGFPKRCLWHRWFQVAGSSLGARCWLPGVGSMNEVALIAEAFEKDG